MRESIGCPCGCYATGLRLTARGHLRGCYCRGCTGARNRSKGQAAERRSHRSLGGTGRTPQDEYARTYSINVTPQVKQGAQIPAMFCKFVEGAWYREAVGQARAAIPIGMDSRPAVHLIVPGGRAYLVVETT